MKYANFEGNKVDTLLPIAVVFPNAEFLNFCNNNISDPDEVVVITFYINFLFIYYDI